MKTLAMKGDDMTVDILVPPDPLVAALIDLASHYRELSGDPTRLPVAQHMFGVFAEDIGDALREWQAETGARRPPERSFTEAVATHLRDALVDLLTVAESVARGAADTDLDDLREACEAGRAVLGHENP